MERLPKHILRGGLAALLLACGASCEHAPQYVFTDPATGKPIAEVEPTSTRVECPKCYRMLTCCQGAGFTVEGAAGGTDAAHGVAWACPVHGYVATTPSPELDKNTCTHGGKAPARIVDPSGNFAPALLLRCKDCGAGGLIILEQKGATKTFYCAG